MPLSNKRAALALAFATTYLMACGQLPPVSSASARSADDVFLDHLLGAWTMDGDVRGTPAHYHAEGRRVLGSAWLQFDFADAAAQPAYRASVFLAADDKAHDYVAHWLDKFGGAGARVTATGRRQGEEIIIVFPYEAGAFRNLWRFDAQRDAWSLEIEAQVPAGTWVHFAHYEIRRR